MDVSMNYDVNVSFIKSLINVHVKYVVVIPGYSATIYFDALFADNSILSKSILMAGDDYLLWGTDDTYLTTFIENNLSITITTADFST